jgi:tetratricopeptide (TPR) repeat protein
VLSNLREAAVLVAHTEILDARRQSGAERTKTLERARGWNQQAEQIAVGTLPAALWQQRKELAELLNDTALASTVPAVITPTNTDEDLYLRAAAQISHKDLAGAIRTCQQLTLQSPNHYAGHSLLGLCYYFTGQPRLAADRYLVARPLVKAGKTALHNRAVVLMTLGKYDFAEADLTALLALAPNDASAMSLRGVLRKAQEHYPEAIADYTAALDANGPPICLLNQRASCYEKLNDHVSAQRDREKAASLSPTTKEDHVQVGNQLAQTKPTEALAHYNEALKLDPEYTIAIQGKTHVLGDVLNEWELAIQVQNDLEKLAIDSTPGIAGRAILYARLGKTAESLKDLERISSRTLDTKTIYAVASAYAVLTRKNEDHRESALRYLRRAVREGFRDTKHIENDPDMSALRDTDDFHAIVKLARDIMN